MSRSVSTVEWICLRVRVVVGVEANGDGEETGDTYVHIDGIDDPHGTCDEPYPDPSRQNLRETVEPDDVTECTAGRCFEGEVGGEGRAGEFAVVEVVVGVVCGSGVSELVEYVAGRDKGEVIKVG